MSATDAIQLSLASALAGAALVTVTYILAIIVREIRSERERRRHYVSGRTILRRI